MDRLDENRQERPVEGGMRRRSAHLTCRLHRAAARLAGDRSGSVAIFAGFGAVLVLAVSVIAFDVGRMVILKTQMQNAADSAAMAAARHLDTLDGSRARAEAVAMGAASQESMIQTVGGTAAIEVAPGGVAFFSSYTPTAVAATNDAEASIVQVTIQPRSINFLLAPVLAVVSGNPAINQALVAASAVATTDPIICNAPPLMMCDPLEMEPPIDLSKAIHVGRQVNIKEGPGGVPSAPGEFGLLCLPGGQCGANAIGEALANVNQDRCMSTDVTTAPGSKTVQIQNGVNARVDLGNRNPHNPAPNIVNYPRDNNMTVTTIFGDGNWNRAQFWQTVHDEAPEPGAIPQATRYQTYLFELGESFAKNGKQTIYPVPLPEDMPAGFTIVTPPGLNLAVAELMANRSDGDFDGEPQSTPVDPRRRLMKIALLKCEELDVMGSGTYPTFGRFLEIFLTEEVRGTAEPYGGHILGEVVRMINSSNSEDILANVRLVE